ncbi:MAG: hypothetical protein WEB58_14975 [Planctomycetaceae bacterium]
MVNPLTVMLVFDGLFLGIGGWLVQRDSVGLTLSLLAAAAVIGLWQWVLFSTVPHPAKTLKVNLNIHSHHYVQACLHSTLYVYWGLYWDDVGRFAGLILIQIVFAYLIEMLLNWIRGRTWGLGFGPFPIIFSTNLFLWFREEYFYGQFLLVLLIYLGKEFVTWNRDGRRRHIFNPSAFALTLVCVSLMAAHGIGVTRGVDIVAAFDVPPNFYEMIFLVGLVAQIRFGVTPVSMGTVLALVFAQSASKLVFGTPLFPGLINCAVFLGLTLLITDPSTSPRTHTGRFLFGMLYGLGIFLSDVVLRLIYQPSFVDKIVVVPALNLMVPWIDRLTSREPIWIGKINSLLQFKLSRQCWVGAYVVLFLLIVPQLKVPESSYSTILPPPVVGASAELGRLLGNKIYAGIKYPQVYRPFGFRAEYENFRHVKQIYSSEPDSEMIDAVFEFHEKQRMREAVSP